jgi:hypothetical protein
MSPPDFNELKPSATENEAEKHTKNSVTTTAPSEAIESKFDLECYLEQASLKCTNPILINSYSYCIVIPMSELPHRKLMCCLQIHSPSQKDWYKVSFSVYIRDEDGNMGFLESK